MNLIWEVFQNIEKQDGDLEQLEVRPAKVSSPYYELSLDFINDQFDKQGQVVEINPLYRYPKVFEEYLDMDAVEKEEEEERNIVFNQILHYFYQIERYKNATKEELYIDLLMKNIEEGCYGKQVKSAYEQLRQEERQKVTRVLLRTYQLGLTVELFREAAKIMFPTCYVYYEGKRQTILMYTAMGKERISLLKVELLKELFMPIGLTLEVFWKYHFGIVDVDETMVLDQMELD